MTVDGIDLLEPIHGLVAYFANYISQHSEEWEQEAKHHDGTVGYE